MFVVGDPCSEFVRTMVRLAGEYEVAAVLCENIYAAVARLAGTNGRRTLIVGPIRELARENGRLFALAAAGGNGCCCVLEKGAAAQQETLVAAVRAGAFVIGAAQEVGRVLEEWLAVAPGRPRRLDAREFLEDDMRATEAELIALLGHGTDA